MSLPYDKELYYIESTGTQYIDTNYILSNNQNNRLYIECASTDNNGAYKWIFGSKGGTKQSVFAFANSNGSLYTEIKGSNWTSSDYKFALDSKNVIELDSTSITFNGSPYLHGGSFVYSGVSITIFGCKTSTGLYDNKFIGRIYAAKIYDNDTLVRDFIPVKVGQEGCLYDKVSGEIFRNAGTGSFILGSPLMYHSPLISNVRRRLLYAKPKEVPNYLCFTALENGTFTFSSSAGVTTSQRSYIEYSVDNGVTWVKTEKTANVAMTVTTPIIAPGGKVLWRGIGSTSANNNGWAYVSQFSSTGKYNVSGVLSSLFYGKDFKIDSPTKSGYYAARLFYQNTGLINAKDLILSPIMHGACYYGTFDGCTNLTSIPNEIPSFPPNASFCCRAMYANTAIATLPTLPKSMSSQCYYAMFRGCNLLTTIPNDYLQATTIESYCYCQMFYNCKSLESVPFDLLPATTLANNCYQEMFYGCTNLVNTPNLPATILANNCYYQMFYGCSNLVDIPNLPATSLADNCYWGMFRDAVSLTGSVFLPAAVLLTSSYRNIFYNTKIDYVKMLATDVSASNAINNWMYGVPANGIFVKHIDAQWTTTGASGVPTNWTVIYYDPALDKYYLDQQRSQECDDHGNPI